MDSQISDLIKKGVSVKKLILVFTTLLLSTVVNAQETKLTCELIGGAGPFDNFKLVLPKETPFEVEKGQAIEVSGYLNSASGSIDAGEEEFSWKEAAEKDDRERVTIVVDVYDWAAISFLISQDDEGITAYVEHSSDSGALNSLYRCL